MSKTKDKPGGIIATGEPAPAASKATHGPVDGVGAPTLLSGIKPSCDSCACGFFTDEENMETPGRCRAKSPTPFNVFMPPAIAAAPGTRLPPDAYDISIWPWVFRQQWCVHDFVPKMGTMQ